ncbi:MAG: hypothetical protein AB1606_07250 [Nitrospirota bacterium]
MTWNKKDISEALGITGRRLNQLIKDKIIPNPKNADVKAVIKAYILFIKSGNKDLLAERTRLTKINADRKELMLKKERGELIETEKAMTLWGNVIMVIRSKLLAIPTKLSPLILGCRDIVEIKTTMEKYIYEVLTELSNPNLKAYRQIIDTQIKKYRKNIKR